MTRQKRLTRSFTKDMRLIEIGASYSPLIPKSEGWQTTIVDHADQAALKEKYRDNEFGVDKIEEVDYIWRDGSITDAIPEYLHGTFDGIIASHVGEHMPDLIGFMVAAARLLKPSGALVLALPDKRLCFDFFHPATTTGALLDARGNTRHSIGTHFNHAAYMTERETSGAWVKGGPVVPFHLTHDFSVAESATIPKPEYYFDSHTWYFTPSSFHLIIMELNLLRLIPWDIERLEPNDAVEFYAWLRPHRIVMTPEVAAQRLDLLKETVMETKVQIAMLEKQPEIVAPARPSISAIIPLYNGAKYIEEALNSILSQTVPPKEIIVVDDGSTDNGPELVRKMAERHPIITLLSKSNGGQSSARNLGVAHSTGDLIALLDQDDIWYPVHLEKLVEPFMENMELGWVYSDLDEIDSEGLMIHHNFLSTMGVEHPKSSLFNCISGDMFILPSASLISRKAFDAVSGFDERLSGYEDDDLFLRLFRNGYRNVFLRMALSKWRISTDSASYSYRMRRSRLIYCRKLIDMFPDQPKRDRFVFRDFILPRFYHHAVIEYRDALESGIQSRIEETRNELRFLIEKNPSKRRRNMGRIMTMIKTERGAKMVLASRHILRPVLRRII